MAIPTKVRLASTAQIEDLNDQARVHPLNRALDGLVDDLDPDGWHVLTPIMEPSQHPSAEVWVPHYRCCLVYKLPGDGEHGVTMIDVATSDFEQLWTEEALHACLDELRGMEMA